MYKFYVNDELVTAEEDGKLLPFLRNVCQLKSVKDGCSEGACGTCMVIVDGKATKACIPKLSKLDGKHIITVEGLSDFEKEVYDTTFSEAGAVQCGFCIPGMVISAKALLDVNNNPTRDEIAFAIRNNICRCTGYKKIIDAIENAAKMIRENKVVKKEYEWKIGESVPRVDAREKILGYGEYTDDMEVEGMLYGSCVRSKYPRAKVLRINTMEAKLTKGVSAVFTAKDIKGAVKIGHLKKDWDVLIPEGHITHYLGDAIALVVGETPEAVEEGKKLVEVEYEELPFVSSPEEAMKEDAPLVHEDGNLLARKFVSRGDARGAIEKSKFVLTDTFHTPYTEHAFLEPECSVAIPEEDGGIHIYSSDQGVFDTRHECAMMLGIDPEKVKVTNKLVGGGFGGKEDLAVQQHAALAAYLLQCPVKVKLTRQESILIHPKRHPMDMKFTVGCDENGIIQGVLADVISDTGAYASLGGPVLERACTHAAGPYNYQNFEIEGKAYYTNNPPAGAFRGFGVTQTCFAIEMLLTKMAELVGISPWEIRYRNAIRPGQVLPNGQIVDESTGLVETLEAVKEIYTENPHAGIACAMKNAGVGVGLKDIGRCKLEISDNKVHVRIGASEIGQGMSTIFVQIVATHTGLTPENISHIASTTINAPDSGTTSGSRQTLITGEAVRKASLDLKEDLKNNTLAELEGKEYYAEYYEATDPLNSDKTNPKSHVAYGYATQVCILNEEGKVEKIVAAHAVGRAMNPLAVEGQIEGGVIMSLGYALTEQYLLQECAPKSRFATLGLFRANQVPDVESIVIEKSGLNVAHGAIGIGEITSIPTAPAIAGAYYKLDGEFRTSLPLVNTPYKKR
ncbi:MAG: selenium-dependent xanthine dehydrogenase [Epulopiscium sp. Nuni2H_MBin003]|nr:MAG: selenium-dependent xanthine dehydrogenase [Epulopiscium sp. Nuni2H_MBin003]